MSDLLEITSLQDISPPKPSHFFCLSMKSRKKVLFRWVFIAVKAHYLFPSSLPSFFVCVETQGGLFQLKIMFPVGIKW